MQPRLHHVVLGNFDTGAVLALNGFIQAHFWVGKIASALALNDLARGAPVFVPLVVLWFSVDHVGHRGRLVLGLVAACLATIISILLEEHLRVNVRPLFNSALHLYEVNHVDTAPLVTNSFPSDTATLYFSLSSVILLEWRAAGVLAYIWSFVIAGICDVALGYHYPSDIIAGLILGTGAVYLITLFTRSSLRVQFHLEKAEMGTAWIHVALFLFLADAYSQFEGLRGVVNMLTRIASR